MKRVMVSELQAHLSAYLAAVRAGETVTVCDGETAVARIEPIEPSSTLVPVREPAITDPAERARRLASIKPVVHPSAEDEKKAQAIFSDRRAEPVIEPTVSVEQLRAVFDGWEPIVLSEDVDPLAILEELREDRL
jgi:antitoxin (DNA-binding transcriptional repressor) of toxin-antitoxin stability system